MPHTPRHEHEHGALVDPSAGVEKLIAGVAEVAAFAPYAQGVVMLEYEHRPAFPVVQGFDLERIRQVIPLENYLVAGSLDDLDDDSVILSALLASGLGVQVGDRISLYTPLMLERMKKNEVLLPREVRVAGIFRIGHQQLDSSTVICPLRLMQDLYGLGQSVHGYSVRLKPGASADLAAASLNAVLPRGLEALTWFEANADFQAVLSFERNMIFFLLTFIIIVAAFSITSSATWMCRAAGSSKVELTTSALPPLRSTVRRIDVTSSGRSSTSRTNTETSG